MLNATRFRAKSTSTIWSKKSGIRPIYPNYLISNILSGNCFVDSFGQCCDIIIFCANYDTRVDGIGGMQPDKMPSIVCE